jgi:hypothetical protein
MATGKAYYWLALGVLALGLTSEYERGGLQPLHQLANRSTLTANCLLVKAHQYVAMARFLMGEAPRTAPMHEWTYASNEHSRALARVQAELAGRQADLVRLGIDRAQWVNLGREMAAQERQYARLQAERARVIAISRSARKTVNCKHDVVHVAVNTDVDDEGEINVVAEEN